MRFVPHDYQKTAVRWILEKPRCGLFLDLGLGKSVITLTAIRQLMDDCEVERTLVVAPKKVAESTWCKEARKWEHLKDLRFSLVLGSTQKRIRALNTPADIWVINRDNVQWLCD